MSQKVKIPGNFWKQNPLQDMSAAQLAYFNMCLAPDNPLNDKIFEIAAPAMTPQRQAKIDEERREIAALDSAEAVVKFMRRESDIANRGLLCQKALEMQDEIMPLLLRRYQTNATTVFIEAAAMVFAHCGEDYTVRLRELYPTIRDPYATSMASVALAVRADTEAIPLLLREYERLHREYPEKSYDQGPLIALYSLYGRI